MVQPYNYQMAGIQSPFESVVQGLKLGATLETLQLEREKQRQAMALAQQQAEQQRAAAARRAELMGEYARGTITQAGIAELAMSAGSEANARGLWGASEQMGADRRNAMIGQNAQLSVMMARNPAVALQELDRLEAADPNNPRWAEARRLLQQDPMLAAKFTATGLLGMGQDGLKAFEQVAEKAGFAAKEPAAKGPFVVGGALVSAEGVPLYQSPETAAKPIVVGNALVSPTGQVLYKAEAGEPNPVVVGSRVVNPRTGQVIFEAPPEDRPIIVGRDVVTRDGRLIYRAPADQPAPMTVGGNIVDPSTGRVIYASPEAAQKPIVLSPGQSVFDPETNRPIFTAPRDANTGVVGNKLIDMQTGRVIQEFSAEPGRAYVVGGNLVAPSGEVLFRAEDERVRPVVVDGKVVNAANGNVIYSAPEGKKPMVVNGNIVDANTGEVLYRSPTDGGQESVISRTLRDLGLEPTLENARKYHQAIRAPEAMTALQKAQAYRQTLIASGQRGSEEFKENERYIDNLLVDPGKLTEAQIQANALAERRIALLEKQNDPTFRAQVAAAEAAGAATGRQQVERASAVGEINTVVSELERALEKGGLIDRATGSGVGALRDVAAGFFGQATPGAIAVGQLQPIADLVLKIIPRFEGPQSDKDTQSYREAAGKLADPTVPNEIRRAAAKEIVRVLKDRKGRLGSTVTIPMQPAGNAVPAAGAAPAAAAAVPQQGQATAPSAGFPTPPQAAIDALRAGRGTAAQFDEVFGPGAAARVMGR